MRQILQKNKVFITLNKFLIVLLVNDMHKKAIFNNMMKGVENGSN